jgi:hypothetical protein
MGFPIVSMTLFLIMSWIRPFILFWLCSQMHSQAFLDTLGDSPTALLLPAGQVELSLFHNRINSTLDIFDFRELQNPSSDTVGDMKGWGMGLRFGLSPSYTLLYDRSLNHYDFGRGLLDVESEDFSIRRILRENPKKNQLISLQLSHRRNRGAGLNKLFSKITFQNSNFVFNPPARFDFGGSLDRELAVMLVGSRQVRPKLLLSLFGKLGWGEVISEVNTDLPVNELQEILDVLSYHQKKRELGYSLHYKMDPSQTLFMDYHYLILKRSKDVSDPVRVNEILNAGYQKKLSSRGFWFLKAKFMKNQFIGEHSFLYNKRVASRSKRHYGYLGAGYTLRYGYGE